MQEGDKIMGYPKGEMTPGRLEAMGIKPEEMSIGKLEGSKEKLSKAIGCLEKGDYDKAFSASTGLDVEGIIEMAQRFRDVNDADAYADLLERRAMKMEGIDKKIERSRIWQE